MRSIQLQVSEPRPEPRTKNASTQTKPDESAKENDSVMTKLSKCVVLLSHANTKLDALGERPCQRCHQLGTSSNPQSRVKLVQISLQPVKSLTDFENLQESFRDDNFVKQTVASIGSVHGRHRYTGRGATVSFQIIDLFFARDFLLQCSWTGTSRSSGNLAGNDTTK